MDGNTLLSRCNASKLCSMAPSEGMSAFAGHPEQSRIPQWVHGVDCVGSGRFDWIGGLMEDMGVLEQINRRRPSIPVAAINENVRGRGLSHGDEHADEQAPGTTTAPAVQADEATAMTQASTSTSEDPLGGEDEPLLVNLQNEGE